MERKRKYQRGYAKRNQAYTWEMNLKLRGVTVEQYEAQWKRQGGVCAICHKPETAKHQSGTLKRLAVDHSHASGKIRGLLCTRCNPGIGYFQDDPTLLRRAAEYLANHA